MLILAAVFFLSPHMIKYQFLYKLFPFLLTVLVIASLLLGDLYSD